MKTVRNILLFVLIMSVVFVVASCRDNGDAPDETKQTTTVVTTTGSDIVITTTAPVTTTQPVVTTTGPVVTTTLPPITTRKITPPTDIQLITPAVTYFKYEIQMPTGYENDQYVSLEFSEDDLGVGDLVLVNSNHKIIDEELLLKEMDTIYENRALIDGKGIYGLLTDKQKGAKTAIKALNELVMAYREQGGTLFPVIYTAYRTLEEQEKLYREKEKTYGEDTPMYVSIPGYSDYHTGLGFNFKIQKDGLIYEYDSKTAAPFFEWLKENAHKHGFIFRYPENKVLYTGIKEDAEPYHIRYVGKAHALFMLQYDLCLEEYIDYLRSYEFGKYHLIMYFVGTQYEIFFVPNDEELNRAKVARDAVYTVSGNNVDGYIVTIYRDLSLK